MSANTFQILVREMAGFRRLYPESKAFDLAEDLIGRLNKKFSPNGIDEEGAALDRFFASRKFSLEGESAIAAIFLNALEESVDADRAIRCFEIEWLATWVFQPHKHRGNPDAPGEIGERNRAVFNAICAKLGLTQPFKMKQPNS